MSLLRPRLFSSVPLCWNGYSSLSFGCSDRSVVHTVADLALMVALVLLVNRSGDVPRTPSAIVAAHPRSSVRNFQLRRIDLRRSVRRSRLSFARLATLIL